MNEFEGVPGHSMPRPGELIMEHDDCIGGKHSESSLYRERLRSQRLW